MKSYFNTTNENSAIVKNYTEKSKTQEEIIIELFKKYERLTPSNVFAMYPHNYFAPTPPITSIRRAITVLSNKGKLEKTHEKKIGIYGRNERIYKII